MNMWTRGEWRQTHRTRCFGNGVCVCVYGNDCGKSVRLFGMLLSYGGTSFGGRSGVFQPLWMTMTVLLI